MARAAKWTTAGEFHSMLVVTIALFYPSLVNCLYLFNCSTINRFTKCNQSNDEPKSAQSAHRQLTFGVAKNSENVKISENDATVLSICKYLNKLCLWFL